MEGLPSVTSQFAPGHVGTGPDNYRLPTSSPKTQPTPFCWYSRSPQYPVAPSVSWRQSWAAQRSIPVGANSSLGPDSHIAVPGRYSRSRSQRERTGYTWRSVDDRRGFDSHRPLRTNGERPFAPPVSKASESYTTTAWTCCICQLVWPNGQMRDAKPSLFPPTLLRRGAPRRQSQRRRALQLMAHPPEIEYSFAPPLTAAGMNWKIPHKVGGNINLVPCESTTTS